MTLNPLLTVLGAIAFLLTTVALTLRRQHRGGWLPPALLASVFLVFTLYTVHSEGLLGFWSVHAHSWWGNQVWLDLLLAVAIAWLLLLPRLRAAGIAPLPWLLLIACSGSIGLLLTLARLFWRESHSA